MTDKRVIDELREESKQPAIIYCVNDDRVFATRRATTLSLKHHYSLGRTTVHTLDAFPEPGQIGWRDVTADFIASRVDEATGKTQYGVRLVDGQVRWT